MWNRKQLCGRKKIHTVLGSRKRERENVINKHVRSCILVASARAYMMTRYRKPVIRVFKLFNSSCLFSLSLYLNEARLDQNYGVYIFLIDHHIAGAHRECYVCVALHTGCEHQIVIRNETISHSLAVSIFLCCELRLCKQRTHVVNASLFVQLSLYTSYTHTSSNLPQNRNFYSA